jgi:hypothetical protein
VAVGRIELPDAGHAVFNCASNKVEGPGGYGWCPYAEGAGTSEWSSTVPPTSAGVSFVAHSPVEVRAGVAFQFDANGEFRDLSTFDSMNLSVDITEGDSFEVFLGQGPSLGCSYVFPNKSANGLYSTMLRNAAWCIPSQCGFNLQSSGGLLLARVPVESRLVATVKSLTFSSTGVASGSVSAMSAGKGPGGLCWFLIGWNYGTAGWVPGQVTSSSAFVSAHATGGAVAGMAFEIPGELALSQYRQIRITADVKVTNASSTFLIQGVSEERGVIWTFSPQSGPSTYLIQLLQPNSVFPGGTAALGLDEIKRFEIVSPVGGTSDLEANVTAVEFLR